MSVSARQAQWTSAAPTSATLTSAAAGSTAGPAPDPTRLAIANWLEPLFAALGFGRLPLVGASGLGSDDGTKTFPISHRWTHVPIHFVPWDADLDRKPAGVQGAAPPQSLVQELLNRSEGHLWAMLSNGRQLRLLHDSASLVGASYVEFDLEAIFDGELFSEFVLLYRLLHVSRFEVAPDARPEACRLEQWRNEAIDSGMRAVDQLRDGVRKAVESLGTGFTQHPANAKLRGDLDSDELKKALLRLVYRLLFVFVAEDRNILIPEGADAAARARYDRYFSTARLRETARRRQGTTHGDRWEALRGVLDHLRAEGGFAPLGLPGLGGIFEHNETDAVLDGARLSNEALFGAMRALSIVRD
ncbi:MAG: Eco57I restriction-modification methylase domain-containing protein, partial [Gaiellaceae bacterium]